MQVETFTWLASYPKSGNTWLRLLIAAYFNGGHVNINRDTVTTSDNLTYWYQAVSPLPVRDLSYAQLFALRSAALFNQLCSRGTPETFIKTHHANLRFGDGPRLIPTELSCRAIYIIRDPRDVALSMARYLAKPVREIVRNMSANDYAIGDDTNQPHILSAWSTHVETWVNQDQFPLAVLRYEDLIANPIQEFSAFLEFCKIEPDKQLVAKCVEACGLENLRRQEQMDGFKEDRKPDAPRTFFGKGGSRWIAELEPSLARRIESEHGEMMRRYGYLTDEAMSIPQ